MHRNSSTIFLPPVLIKCGNFTIDGITRFYCHTLMEAISVNTFKRMGIDSIFGDQTTLQKQGPILVPVTLQPKFSLPVQPDIYSAT